MAISMDIKKYLNKISRACHQIARKKYQSVKELEELSLESKHPKVIADLAENISFMVLQLQGREYELEQAVKELNKAKAKLKEKNIKLRDEVHHLKIEIDKAKQEEQVAEILESKAFKKIKQAKKDRKK